MFMPASGSASAPVFDPAKPRQLLRYFDTLEFLLSQANVTDNLEKIKAAIRYVDFDVSYLWRSATAFSASPANYEAFKQEIISFYPDADISNTFTIGQLLNLVSQTRESGIHSVSDVSEYHRQFTTIASFLKSQGRLSELETNREFVRGFQDTLWQRISARLQLTHPDHHPDDPWPVSDVQKATCFVLRGTSSTSSTSSIVPPPHSSAQSPSQPLSSLGAFPVKSEPDHVAQLTSLVMETVKATHALLETFQGIAERSAASLPLFSPPKTCNFCGRGHFIRDCDSVMEYIRLGKCKRNHEGKIVLPSGDFVPSSVPGRLLRDRIDEYHRRNPSQFVSAHLLQPVIDHHLCNVVHPPQFVLSVSDRIAALEAEIVSLRCLLGGPSAPPALCACTSIRQNTQTISEPPVASLSPPQPASPTITSLSASITPQSPSFRAVQPSRPSDTSNGTTSRFSDDTTIISQPPFSPSASRVPHQPAVATIASNSTQTAPPSLPAARYRPSSPFPPRYIATGVTQQPLEYLVAPESPAFRPNTQGATAARSVASNGADASRIESTVPAILRLSVRSSSRGGSSLEATAWGWKEGDGPKTTAPLPRSRANGRMRMRPTVTNGSLPLGYHSNLHR